MRCTDGRILTQSFELCEEYGRCPGVKCCAKQAPLTGRVAGHSGRSRPGGSTTTISAAEEKRGYPPARAHKAC